MAYSVTWDEDTPSGSEARSLGDNRIRELKTQIKERMNELATDFTSDPVVFPHDKLTGLTDDDHTQYLMLTKENQEITQNLSVTALKTIDGRDISVDGTKLDTLSAGLKFITTPVNKLDWTAATDWTDVDISSNTGDDTAKAALLAVQLEFVETTESETGKMIGLFRKNGSSGTSILPRVSLAGRCIANDPFTGSSSCVIVTECHTDEIFEVKLQTDSGSPESIVFKVDLIGYFV